MRSLFLKTGLVFGVVAFMFATASFASAQVVVQTGQWTQSQPSRTFSTVYQNISGVAILVAVSATDTSGARTFDCYSDTTNPPTTKVNRFTNPFGAGYGNCTFIVPQNYYYQVVDEDGVNPVLFRWTEWTPQTSSVSSTTLATSTTTINDPNRDMFYLLLIMWVALVFVVWFFKMDRKTRK